MKTSSKACLTLAEALFACGAPGALAQEKKLPNIVILATGGTIAGGTVATTVEAVQGAVHDTGEALERAFYIPAHVRRHPWLMLGGALFVGYVVAILIGRPRR